MAFTKLSVQTFGVGKGTPATSTPETDIWAVFRALRDTRSLFGLRPGHVQTLQAMLSFLKPGHGDTVFASNDEICRRVGGIDERTLRLARAGELLATAQAMENARRDRVFLRKQILTKLAQIDEADPENELTHQVRRVLRRKLSIAEYRTLLGELEARCKQMSTAVDAPETMKLPANDGQTVRHHSKSKKEQKDLESGTDSETLPLQTLTTVCDQATSFATNSLRNWHDVESHARTLAPMMGIHESTFEKAARKIGSQKASCAIFIILQMSNRIRDFGAYFHSITLGRRETDFNPSLLLERLSRSGAATA